MPSIKSLSRLFRAVLARDKKNETIDLIKIGADKLHALVSHADVCLDDISKEFAGAAKWDKLYSILCEKSLMPKNDNRSLEFEPPYMLAKRAMGDIGFDMWVNNHHGSCIVEVKNLKTLYDQRYILGKTCNSLRDASRYDYSNVTVLTIRGVPARNLITVENAAQKAQELESFLRKFTAFMEKDILPQIDPDWKPRRPVHVGMPGRHRHL